MWIGAAGLCALPMVGWAAVELTTFQKGDAISSADVNDNFTALAEAVTALENRRPRAAELGPAVPSWSGSASAATDPGAVVDGLGVTVETHGQTVSVGLVGSGGQPFLGAEASNTSTEFIFRVERMTDGEDVDWVTVEEFYWRPQAGGSVTSTGLRVPPSTILATDTPPAGSTSYRVLAYSSPDAINPNLAVARVRMRAQELAATAP